MVNLKRTPGFDQRYTYHVHQCLKPSQIEGTSPFCSSFMSPFTQNPLTSHSSLRATRSTPPRRLPPARSLLRHFSPPLRSNRRTFRWCSAVFGVPSLQHRSRQNSRGPPYLITMLGSPRGHVGRYAEFPFRRLHHRDPIGLRRCVDTFGASRLEHRGRFDWIGVLVLGPK